MKHLYTLDYIDTIAADNEEEAIEVWESNTGEAIEDYPEMNIEQIPDNRWITIWQDVYCQDFKISKMASRWARETKYPEILCSTEY